MRADCILVVSDGEIIENGTHAELLRAQGKYAMLWSRQIDIKTDDENQDSTTPEKKDSDLINDLSNAPPSPSPEEASEVKGDAAEVRTDQAEDEFGDGKPQEIDGSSPQKS
jgi:ABC-type multidrug transport system ATPase subunit